MSELKAKDKDVVVPGEVLATGMDFLPSYGTYRDGDNIHANKLGLIQIDGKVLKIIPLSGRYIPKRGDTIIARVTEVMMSGWRVEFGSAWSAVLALSNGTSEYIQRGEDLNQYFTIGDYILTKIIKVTNQKLTDITMKGPGLRRLGNGRIVEVNTNKVPRVIGKQGSMVSMIKNATDCRVIVGQNGLVWVQGEPANELLVEEVIKKIEAESHKSGLTDTIKAYLEKKTGKKIEEKPAQPPQEGRDQK